METTKNHWEHVYDSKQPHEVSWTQEVPQTSLDFINSFNVSKTAPIIDIGGGDSKLVDFLVDEGYENVTVLDISEKALERAKNRLGEKAHKITWIVSDVLDFKPTITYKVWHDRAAFHFLTTGDQIERYTATAQKAVDGYLTIGTFSENGPQKCSGLHIKQYTDEQLAQQLSKGFEKIKCITEDHITPFKTAQNFLFCSFRKKAA